MSKRINHARKAALALAMAAGRTVIDWARENDVPERTAYSWARSREVLDQVEAIRRAAIDRAVGRLSENAIVAADEITRLVRESTSDAVRLQAARAVLADLMAIADHAAFEQRLADLERRLRDGVTQ